MNNIYAIDTLNHAFGLPPVFDIIDEIMPIVAAEEKLIQCPPFRKCKSYKWQRRRNKQFYRILDEMRGDDER